jgi:hypothetical protein
MLLGLDGTVYVAEDNTGIWYKLTPNKFGDYVHGSWSPIATMPSGYQPLYFASQILPDGKMLIEGGEYNGSGTEVWTNLGAIYDPVNDNWTSVSPPTGWSDIGDAQSVLLTNGQFMMAHIDDASDALFNESTLSWTIQSGSGKDDRNDEEGYNLLPNGKVLTIDDENALSTGVQRAQVYTRSTGAWTSAGTLPSVLVHGNDEELGPMVQRPNGQMFAIGGNSQTAVYKGGTRWAAGPTLPGGYDAADGPASILPDGRVLLQAEQSLFAPPSHFWVYNGHTLTQVSDPANAASDPSYVGRMLVLPTGEVMWDDGSGDLEVFSPTGTADPSWAPTITSVGSTIAGGSRQSLAGTQLAGLSGGAAYGDDYQSNTNYPLVRITKNATGVVTYARTYKESTHSIEPGQTGTMSFRVPANTPTGASTLVVVANGIASAPQNVTIN